MIVVIGGRGSGRGGVASAFRQSLARLRAARKRRPSTQPSSKVGDHASRMKLERQRMRRAWEEKVGENSGLIFPDEVPGLLQDFLKPGDEQKSTPPRLLIEEESSKMFLNIGASNSSEEVAIVFGNNRVYLVTSKRKRPTLVELNRGSDEKAEIVSAFPFENGCMALDSSGQPFWTSGSITFDENEPLQRMYVDPVDTGFLFLGVTGRMFEGRVGSLRKSMSISFASGLPVNVSFAAIGIGGSHAVAISHGGVAYAKGDNRKQEISAFLPRERLHEWTFVPIGDFVEGVACSQESTAFVTRSGRLILSGDNSNSPEILLLSGDASVKVKDMARTKDKTAILATTGDLFLIDDGKNKGFEPLKKSGVVALHAIGGHLSLAASNKPAKSSLLRLCGKVVEPLITSSQLSRLLEAEDGNVVNQIAHSLAILLTIPAVLSVAFIEDTNRPRDPRTSSAVHVDDSSFIINGMIDELLEKEKSSSKGGKKQYSYAIRGWLDVFTASLASWTKNPGPDHFRALYLVLTSKLCRIAPAQYEECVRFLFRIEKEDRLLFYQWVSAEVPSEIFAENMVIPYRILLEDRVGLCEEQGEGEKLSEMSRHLQRLSQLNEARANPLRRTDNDPRYVPLRSSLFALKSLASLSKEALAEYLEAWLSGDAGYFHFLDYPHLVDLSIKLRCLRLEGKIQQRQQMRGVPRTPELLFANLTVRREHLWTDTVTGLKRLKKGELRKPLRVKFNGEAGEDAGGVRKEFFQLISGLIFEPELGIFDVIDASKQMLWYPVFGDGGGAHDLEAYWLAGVLIGLALYNKSILDLNFPTAFFRILLKKMPDNPKLEHLAELDPVTARGLLQLLDYDGEDLEDVFSLTFEFKATGADKPVELIKNGSQIGVTQKNKHDYINAISRYLLIDSVDALVQETLRGFETVINMAYFKTIALLNMRELELAIGGIPEVNIAELKASTHYDGGFSASHPTILAFWSIVGSWESEKVLRLLKFATGASKVPPEGVQSLNFTIQRSSSDESRLPSASTCFNVLLLPEYSKRDILESKLDQAIELGQGFYLY